MVYLMFGTIKRNFHYHNLAEILYMTHTQQKNLHWRLTCTCNYQTKNLYEK